MLIYKICETAMWDAAVITGAFTGAEIDLVDGYIHFSTAAQMRETAAKHFAGRSGLLVVAVEAEALGSDLKWEPSRGGDLFPHLYRSLQADEVQWVEALTVGADGLHIFPEAAI